MTFTEKPRDRQAEGQTRTSRGTDIDKPRDRLGQAEGQTQSSRRTDTVKPRDRQAEKKTQTSRRTDKHMCLERTLNMWAYLVLGQKRERKRKEEKGVVVG